MKLFLFMLTLPLVAMDAPKQHKKRKLEKASAPATEVALYSAGIGDKIEIEFTAKSDREGQDTAQHLLSLILLACAVPKQSLEDLVKSSTQVTVTRAPAQPSFINSTDMDDAFLDELNNLEGVSPMHYNSPIASPVTLARQASFSSKIPENNASSSKKE
jgi:hypothetical protein